jgi:undecaprenyl-diphosphatase
LDDYLRSLLLGIVEGLTEFLPVSSTAHLRIVEALLQLPLDDPYWKTYTIVIQLGAILCLPVYFRARILQFLKTPLPAGRSALTHPIALVMVAFVTTAGPAFLLTKLIKKHLESLTVMGMALLIGGIVMWIVDALRARWEEAGPQAPGNPIRTWRMDDMRLGQAIWIGACQILSALFPGTSRSMSTIVGGQLVGMSRASALEFSFFLSMPTMAAATGYDLLKALVGKDGARVSFDHHRWTVLAIGFVVSFIVAYGSVAALMAWVRRRGFVPFSVYRVVVGLAVLAWALSIR